MDYKAMLAIGLPLGLGIAALGSGIGLGKAVAAAKACGPAGVGALIGETRRGTRRQNLDRRRRPEPGREQRLHETDSRRRRRSGGEPWPVFHSSILHLRPSG